MRNETALPSSGLSGSTPLLPKVYCWCNQGAGTDFQYWIAMADDGHVITSHICSHESWAWTDLYERKKQLYMEKFGGDQDGEDFWLVWEVAPQDVYERNQALREEYERAQS